MITYVYWLAVFALAGGLAYGIGVRGNQWKIAAAAVIAVLLIGWTIYYFRLQQVFVKRYGGVMTISVPDGQEHISATWKDDNLWIENYDPATNTCYFTEYSKGNLLQGKVTIKKCNPRRVATP